MIKSSSLLIFVAIGLSNFAAAQMATCSQQSNCLEWSSTEEQATTCNEKGECTCQFRMCVQYNHDKFGCRMPTGHTLDKTCVAADDVCEPSMLAGVEVTGYTDKSYQCQVVPPGGSAKFIFEDGAGCAGSPARNGPGYGTSTTCSPNYDSSLSCSGANFVPGSECVWTYNAPLFCDTYNATTFGPGACSEPPTSAPSAAPSAATPDPTPSPTPAPTPAPTLAPTPAPTPHPTNLDGSIGGDPHIQTWAGEKYDFHGVCDLVLLENKNFTSDGIDMNIHIRAKEVAQKFSYVSNAVLHIGEDTLEVASGEDGSKAIYWINGMAGEEITENSDVVLSETIHGYPVTYRRPDGKKAEFEVDLGNNDNIIIRTWGQFVRVGTRGNVSTFKNGRGLMGTIDGTKVARDGVTVIDDVNEFGQEWQVLKNEPKLFHNIEGPQHPEKCIIPSAADVKRRLRESSISQEEAELACSRVTEEERDMCIFDVMATGDLDSAGAY